MSDVTMPEFDQWADDYLRRQYFFYDGKTALSITNPLRAQLKEAWNAGQESKSTPMCTDGDLAEILTQLDGIMHAVTYNGVENRQIARGCYNKIRLLIDAKQGGK